MDPRFQHLGSPVYYAKMSQNTLWLWPAPDKIYVHRVLYIKDPVLPSSLSDSITWVGEPYFLIDGVLSELYLLAFQRSGSEHFSALAAAHDRMYITQLEEASERDEPQRFVPEDVKNLPVVPEGAPMTWWSEWRVERV
jgi:hypothetical protein